MFTGLVEGLGEVVGLTPQGPGVRLVVRAAAVAPQVTLGASVAVAGCCLTVVELDRETLAFEAGSETLSRTTLGSLRVGSLVNLERSVRAGDPLGGHLVTGHVDATGSLAKRMDDANWSTFWFTAPSPLMRQMAVKGSIAVSGVSLTLVDVTDEAFSVALIPHTLQVTTLGGLRPGDAVNLETDILAKYVERQLTMRSFSLPDAARPATA